MKSLSILLYEWKHFVRSPFKVVALLLFLLASIYGLHNGASLYKTQLTEIEKINEKVDEERKENLEFYDTEEKGPEDKPWIDLSTPFWAIWLSNTYHFKTPSPAIVYSIGETEQFGFYKRVNIWASTMDSDMTKEIANPERLQIGTLDFSFALVYLLPLLLLILVYNLRSSEAEQNFLPLIEVQTASKNRWLLSRIFFYIVLLILVIVGLLIYGAMLTGVFSQDSSAFGQVLLYSLLYLLFWGAIYYFILRKGTRIVNNTLKMVGVWLLFAFIIPAISLQWITIEKPANLMTDFINASRDETWDLYDLPDSVVQQQLNKLFPEIIDSPAAKDSTKIDQARRGSFSALSNELLKSRIALIEKDNEAKNQRVRATYFYNPVTFFQNRFNETSQTHYNDYQKFRNEIQSLIDKQIKTLVVDTWNEKVVDKEGYVKYTEELLKMD